MSRSRITIREVATHAGVSHQTVSRVINGSAKVREATRIRVEAAIKELGYRPNVIAQFMAKGRTGTLACLAPNLTDYTFASIIEGAQREALAQGFFLLSAAAPDEKTFVAYVDKLVASGRTEGLMVINPYQDGRFAHIPPQVPVVFAGSRSRSESHINSVALDDVAVAQAATKLLLDQGHRRIATITGPMIEDCAQDRLEGYTAALQQADISVDPEIRFLGDWSAQSGYEAMMTLSASVETLDAVFAQNDQMAVGVLKAAVELDISVPEQLSVIGVDDIPLVSFFTPSLTTFRQEFTEIGRQAVQLLLKSINQDESGIHMLMPAELVLRDSVALANKARR